jgi:hypothetical protein
VTVVLAPVHLAAVDDVDPGYFLVKERGLRATPLSILHVFYAQRSRLDLLLQRFVPARKAVSTYHGSRVFLQGHLCVFSLRLRDRDRCRSACSRVTISSSKQ